MQAELYGKQFNTFKRYKKRKTIYVHLPPKNIAELKPWYLVNVDLIAPYSNYIRQQHPGGAIININVSLTCMMMINSAAGWF